jgi:hypothetical protein
MGKRCGVLALASALALGILVRAAQAPADTIEQEPGFRPPFVVKWHHHEEHFDRVPYVAGNEVHLFAGENFGINVTIVDDQISRITYQPDPAKADVEFKFTQEKKGPMMMLVTRNGLKRRLFFDALMTVPEKKGVYRTRVLPVEPTFTNVESWPHPIVQLVLRNFRFSSTTGTPAAPSG